MKYFKPDLHLFSAVTTAAKCFDVGSAATSTDCTRGPGIYDEVCIGGGGAIKDCITGHAATVNCLAEGSTRGWSCVDGPGAV